MSHEVLQSWLIILSFTDEGGGEGGFKREEVIITPVTFFSWKAGGGGGRWLIKITESKENKSIHRLYCLVQQVPEEGGGGAAAPPAPPYDEALWLLQLISP